MLGVKYLWFVSFNLLDSLTGLIPLTGLTPLNRLTHLLCQF